MITGYTRCYIPSKVHMPCMPVNFQTVNWSFNHINFTYPCTIFQITRPPLQSNQLECSRQICMEKQFHFFRLTMAGLQVTQWNAAWYFAVSSQDTKPLTEWSDLAAHERFQQNRNKLEHSNTIIWFSHISCHKLLHITDIG